VGIPRLGESRHHQQVSLPPHRPPDSALAAPLDTALVMKTIRLFLLDDEPLVRRGLRMRLGMEPDFVVVGEAGDGCTALREVHQLRPDVVLSDIQLPGQDGISLLPEFRAAGCHVVIVSMQDDATTRGRAAAAGASGFVGKHQIDLALTAAIRVAAAGDIAPINGLNDGDSVAGHTRDDMEETR
jgi:DNA-binding NarL/FixJ family response regulator